MELPDGGAETCAGSGNKSFEKVRLRFADKVGELKENRTGADGRTKRRQNEDKSQNRLQKRTASEQS